MNRSLAVVGILLAAPLLAGRAEATGANFSGARKAYPTAKGISCKTCHQNPIGRAEDLNAYGAALKTFKLPQNAKSLTAEDFRAMEKEDAQA